MVCSFLKFETGHNFPFSEKYHGLYIIYIARGKNKCSILRYHLNKLIVSFQNIIILTLLDQQN